MHAVTIGEPGGPEVMALTDLPLPEPGPGEVLVRVLAAGLNRPDLMQRQGLYPPPPGASPILGLEIAGEIVATGPGMPGKTAPAIGTRVCALANGGGYAEYCAVPAGQCLPWPDGYDAIRAAALPETFFTVWSNLVMTAHLAAGERVLIHGGSGGIGTAAIQVARALGAVPYATAGSADKCAQCVELGAEAAIDYRHEDFVDRIAALTDKRGVDVILDVIGGPYLERNLRCLAPDGRLVIIALQGGARAQEVGLARIMTRRLTVTGTTLRPRDGAYKARIAQGLRETIWPLLAKRTIAPLIHATFPFAQVVEAHKLMESGVHSGKIVLDMQAG
ncbi:NAD(P)H-quinone oxidoreductase [Gluconacetobacter azotocaptans]|uniref:NAD(P)H-quinone oxidoreductase n=1 Tax=Gluconacetobacter azotocaptans TaxID=142834 RepID=UPI00195E6998|nr:NAD(P)H-quinone oxidoreductase [Gluconacetobacter azotocaptans]MBM9402239.1 NAD(P)H-quinone oxidoreductase [Gluconacetobacter azotocaptans]